MLSCFHVIPDPGDGGARKSVAPLRGVPGSVEYQRSGPSLPCLAVV